MFMVDRALVHHLVPPGTWPAPAHRSRADATMLGMRATSYLGESAEVRSSASEGELNNLGLACPICLGFFCDAVSLPCGHAFCRLCLLQTTRLSPDGRSCPLCRVPVVLLDPLTCEGDEGLNQRVQAMVSPEDYFRRQKSFDVALQELQKLEQHSLPVFYMGPGCTVGERVTLRLLETQYQLLITRAVEGKRTFLYGDGVPAYGKYAVVVQVMDARSSNQGRTVVGIGMERVQMTRVWTDENAKGLYYAQCSSRMPAYIGPQIGPTPVITNPDLIPVFYRSSGTAVGRLVALRLCQPRYIFMFRLIMGPTGSERFIYAKYEPTNGLQAVMVSVQRVRWKPNEEQHVYLEGKGVQEGTLQGVVVPPGGEGLHFAVFQPTTDVPVTHPPARCRCTVS